MVILSGALFSAFTFALQIKDRFGVGTKLTYKVYFNGIASGHLVWEYLGCEKIAGHNTEIIAMNSDANIAVIIDLKGNDKVFLDSGTLLPVKVERDIIVFGKKEVIQELYDQKRGEVKIIKNGKETIIKQEPPIHNILALLYFFPKNTPLKKGEEMTFNLPTQKVKIKMHEEREIDTGKEKRKTYLLIGRGAKRFNMWLDVKDNLPARIEFILPVGKITVIRQYPD